MLRKNESPAARERGRAGDEKSRPISDSKGSARRQQEIIAATAEVVAPVIGGSS